jgi:hypothetical protein
MRGSVGVVLGASGDTAGFMDIHFPSRPALVSGSAAERRRLHQKHRKT